MTVFIGESKQEAEIEIQKLSRKNFEQAFGKALPDNAYIVGVAMDINIKSVKDAARDMKALSYLAKDDADYVSVAFFVLKKYIQHINNLILRNEKTSVGLYLENEPGSFELVGYF